MREMEGIRSRWRRRGEECKRDIRVGFVYKTRHVGKREEGGGERR
jgi:hypothetical protein